MISEAINASMTGILLLDLHDYGLQINESVKRNIQTYLEAATQLPLWSHIAQFIESD